MVKQIVRDVFFLGQPSEPRNLLQAVNYIFLLHISIAEKSPKSGFDQLKNGWNRV